MITKQSPSRFHEIISPSISIKPFHDENPRSLGEALNEEYWRHGITISLGNRMSVSLSEAQVRDRLRYIALRLKRRIWGNNHDKQRKIEFFVFRHRWINKHKRQEEKKTGSANWSDRWQKELVERKHQELETF
jgi:hypothetical protein